MPYNYSSKVSLGVRLTTGRGGITSCQEDSATESRDAKVLGQCCKYKVDSSFSLS